jgi:hypothetical protein
MFYLSFNIFIIYFSSLFYHLLLFLFYSLLLVSLLLNLDKKLFVDSIRPSFESALSVSRIGSAAQSKWIKTVSGGIKNTITYLRKETQLNSNQRLFYLLNSLNIIFYSNHLFINPIELSLTLLLCYSLSRLFTSLFSRYVLEFILYYDLFLLVYFVLCSLSYYGSLSIWSFSRYYIVIYLSIIITKGIVSDYVYLEYWYFNDLLYFYSSYLNLVH